MFLHFLIVVLVSIQGLFYTNQVHCAAAQPSIVLFRARHCQLVSAGRGGTLDPSSRSRLAHALHHSILDHVALTAPPRASDPCSDHDNNILLL